MAAIATMILLLFLVSMLTAVLRANAMDRRKTLFLQDQFRARAVAERGVALAVRNCADGKCLGEASETGDDYVLTLSWSPSDADQGLILIHSEVSMTRGEFEPVHVALNIQTRTSDTAPRIISWSED
jgi:hypothetical protein